MSTEDARVWMLVFDGHYDNAMPVVEGQPPFHMEPEALEGLRVVPESRVLALEAELKGIAFRRGIC